MANIKSAKKRILVTETRTARNKAIKSEVKTMVKKVYAVIDSKDQEAAKAALKAAISTMDKATSKGVYHKNTTSRKISRMELIIAKIFERAKAHPEIIPDLNRLMDYYLPMTVKLLNAYEEMDSQPVQGENITSSKKEIEETIDTLNVAFEKLLDSIFEDTAMDVSSDISVLNTVLAQEGLTEDELTRMRKEAEKNRL